MNKQPRDERDERIAELEAKVQRLERLLRKQCAIAWKTEEELAGIIAHTRQQAHAVT